MTYYLARLTDAGRKFWLSENTGWVSKKINATFYISREQCEQRAIEMSHPGTKFEIVERKRITG